MTRADLAPRGPAMLRINDVARELAVSRRTITSWISAGRLPAVKLGPSMQSAVRIRREDLEEFLAGGGR